MWRHNQRTDQNTPQTNHRKDSMSSRPKQNWPILANVTPSRYDDEKKGHVPRKKLENLFNSRQMSFGIQFTTFQWKCKTRKHQAKTWPSYKKPSSINYTTILINTMKNKGSVSKFLLLYLNKTWAPSPKLACISKKSIFFLALAKHKHNSYTSRATKGQVN